MEKLYDSGLEVQRTVKTLGGTTQVLKGDEESVRELVAVRLQFSKPNRDGSCDFSGRTPTFTCSKVMFFTKEELSKYDLAMGHYYYFNQEKEVESESIEQLLINLLERLGVPCDQ